AILAAGTILAQVSLHFTTEVPARGGTYYEGVVGVPRFINPLLALSDSDRDMTALVHAGLMRTTPEGEPIPDIAESYSISDDHLTYTFTIRSGAEFHDGTPITASDVAFTIGLAQSPGLKSPKRPNWEGVVVTEVDERTVSFTLKSPYAPFLQNTTMGILPKHLWQNVSQDEFPFSTLNLEAIGAGPYQIEDVRVSQAGIPEEVRLEAFVGAHAVPYIEEMVFTFYGDQEALATAVIENPSLAAHSISPEAAGDHRVEEAVLGRVFGVFFNQNQNELFADKIVRGALDDALDKKALLATLVSGYGSPLSGPLPPRQVLDTGDEPDVDHLASAKERLAAAGWSAGEDGVLARVVNKATKRLTFTLVTGNAPELKHAAEVVAEAWRGLGAEVTTQFFEASDLQQSIIRPRKYDALLFGEVIGRDVDLFAFWHSSQRNDPGLNIAMYANSTADKMLEEVRTIEDPEERRVAAEEVAGIIAEEHAAVFLYAPHFVYLVPTSLRGITLPTMTTPADRFIGVTDWYLTKERVWPLFK
ncbi:MAG: ABC transporter substrate-binding protein, partial [Patescibacteria group bacterium]